MPLKKKSPRSAVCGASIRETYDKVLCTCEDSYTRSETTAQDDGRKLDDLTDFACGLGEALDKNSLDSVADMAASGWSHL